MNARVGTRGSDLALWQTRLAVRLLREKAPDLQVEEIIIRTQAEKMPDAALNAESWPSGGFVREIEQALLAGEIDLAVHSHKDLPSADVDGLVIAAILERGPKHDCLIARDEHTARRLMDALQRFDATGTGTQRSGEAALTIGTSSPRRAAQLRRALGVDITPLRGNVPTRLKKLHEQSLDAVCLAAAGIDRLGLTPAHRIDLALDQFPTAPAQGAIAIHVRAGRAFESLAGAIDHAPTRRAVAAERSFLAAMEAGCQTPLAASATLVDEHRLSLNVQVFGRDGTLVDAREEGDDPLALGRSMAKAALARVAIS